MADTVEITVSIKRNGVTLTGFPVTRLFTADAVTDASKEHGDDTAVDETDPAAWAEVGGARAYMPKMIFAQFVAGEAASRLILNHLQDAAHSTLLYPFVLEPGGFLLAVGLEASESNAALRALNSATDPLTERVVFATDQVP